MPTGPRKSYLLAGDRGTGPHTPHCQLSGRHCSSLQQLRRDPRPFLPIGVNMLVAVAAVELGDGKQST